MLSTRVLRRYCDSALVVLQSKYHVSKSLQHSATAGSVREQIIKDFLAEHLPELVSIVSGQIFDSNDNFSKQQDVVLVLKSMPRLPFASGVDLIFQDGVVATIEIKTTLQPSVLKAIGDNIASVRALASSTTVTSQIGVAHRWPPHRVLTAIVTYGGAPASSLSKQLSQMDSSARPDLVLDLSQYLLVRNEGLLLNSVSGDDYICIPDAGEGFVKFLTFLTEITGTLSSRSVSWRDYW